MTSVSRLACIGMLLVAGGLFPSLRAQSPLLDSLEAKLDTTPVGPTYIKILTDLAWYTKEDHHFAEAEAYAWQARHLADIHDHPKGKANAWNVLGLIDFNRSRYDSAVLFFDSALVVFRELHDTTGQIAILNNKGQMLGNAGRCTEALPLFQEAIGILLSQPKDVSRRLYSIRLNQATALFFCYQYETALHMCEELLADLEAIEGDSYGMEIVILYNLIGVAHIELKEADKALDILDTGEAKIREMGIEYAINVVRANRAMALVALKRYEEAIAIFEDTNEGYGEVMINDGISEMNLGTALVKVGRYAEALQYARDGLQKLLARGEIGPLPRAYRTLAEALAGVGDTASAYEPLMQSTLLNDSLKDLQITGRVQELNAAFETQRISYALQNAQLEIDLNRQRILLLSSVLGAVILIGVLAYLAFYIRSRRKAYEAQRRQIELEYSVLRTQMNPHFIFNALNSIQGFFADQDFIRGNEYLGAFAFLMRKVLNQSARQAISLEEEIETLKLYLELEQARLGEQLSYDIALDEAVEAPWIMIPPLILQPFVENAIWHGIAPKSGPGHIQITLHLDPDETHLHCSIRDDGVGLKKISTESAHESKGINITRERLGPGGAVAVKAAVPGPGVIASVVIPL